MESPHKHDKLIAQEQELEEGSDGIPQDIWNNIKENENFIYYGLMFLNASVLWGYYSCLSAQDFYKKQFNNELDFEFLTTLVTGWPMVGGHFLQMVFALDKKWDQHKRVYAAYSIFIFMAICIMIFSAIDFEDKKLGGILVLICFGIIGASNSLSESTYYLVAALFPVEKFTNGVQIGNVSAGVFNITIATIIRLAVGGVDQTGDSTKISFYLFFSLMIVVCVSAMFMYNRLMKLPCICFLMERNRADTKEHGLATQGILATLRNLVRIFRIIWMPAIAQFLVFFVSLGVFPGFGCTGGRILSYKFNTLIEKDNEPTSSNWYCAPGIIGSYNYGDFIGRILCTATVYKIFSMKLSFTLTCLRIAYIPLLLMGVAGSSFFVFGGDEEASAYTDITTPLIYNVIVNFTVGVTTGLLSTVTMGTAPRLVAPEDRESAGSITVLFLFLGIAGGATFGTVVSQEQWLGL